MKIEKGMTLEQFVDNQKEHFEIYETEKVKRFAFGVILYNNRLKEPLTNDMLVNSYEKPKREAYFIDGKFKEKYYLEDLKTWKEAEKKLIFKDAKKRIHQRFGFIIGVFEISFANADYPRLYVDGGTVTVQTLGDLFRATNGELELKNFEI